MRYSGSSFMFIICVCGSLLLALPVKIVSCE